MKAVRADGRNAIRDDDAAQAGTPVKSAFAEMGQAGGQLARLDRLVSIEGIIADGDDGVRDRRDVAGVDALKGVIADAPDAVFGAVDHDVGDFLGVGVPGRAL